MSWDSTWEHIFSSRNWGRYPPEELIRFVARNFFSRPDRQAVKILEVGCGPGANIWFLAREGFDVYGIDGSKTAIAQAKQRLQAEALKANLSVGDIILLNELYPESYFDAIIDVACIQCNRILSVQTILDHIMTILKPNAKVFSMMVTAESYGDGLGQEVEPGTFVDISDGPLYGMGLCHFFTLEEIQQLFASFAEVQIEYSTRSLNNQQYRYKHWVIEGTKPG